MPPQFGILPCPHSWHSIGGTRTVGGAWYSVITVNCFRSGGCLCLSQWASCNNQQTFLLHYYIVFEIFFYLVNLILSVIARVPGFVFSLIYPLICVSQEPPPLLVRPLCILFWETSMIICHTWFPKAQYCAVGGTRCLWWPQTRMILHTGDPSLFLLGVIMWKNWRRSGGCSQPQASEVDPCFCIQTPCNKGVKWSLFVTLTACYYCNPEQLYGSSGTWQSIHNLSVIKSVYLFWSLVQV